MEDRQLKRIPRGLSLSSEIQVWLFGVHDQAKLCDVEPLCSCYPFDANSKSLTITRLSAHVWGTSA